mmetsp:Transcript_8370/g.24031  ORF Transcript_8370/g.24031 Transcript_8370/m.24031 type:complete len:291 (-) Transcript_8370:123-995(-)
MFGRKLLRLLGGDAPLLDLVGQVRPEQCAGDSGCRQRRALARAGDVQQSVLALGSGPDDALGALHAVSGQPRHEHLLHRRSTAYTTTECGELLRRWMLSEKHSIEALRRIQGRRALGDDPRHIGRAMPIQQTPVKHWSEKLHRVQAELVRKVLQHLRRGLVGEDSIGQRSLDPMHIHIAEPRCRRRRRLGAHAMLYQPCLHNRPQHVVQRLEVACDREVEDVIGIRLRPLLQHGPHQGLELVLEPEKRPLRYDLADTPRQLHASARAPLDWPQDEVGRNSDGFGEQIHLL